MSESPRYFEYAYNENPCKLVSRYGNNTYDYYDECDDDVCESCKNNTPLYNCNKCGDGICDDEECSMKFPHYSNTTFFICMSCVDEISLKLILQIDLGKLTLLKEKIRTGTTCNSVCSSRRTSRSRSSCSINMNSISSLSEVSTPDSHRARHNSINSSGSDEFLTFVKNIPPL